MVQDLENTGKPFYYYADVLRVSYGELIYIPLGWIAYKSYKKKTDGRLWALLVWIVIPYLFFSFSATKLQGYTLFCAAALFLVAALFIDQLMEKKIIIRYNWLRVTLLVLLIALPIRYSIERLKPLKGVPSKPDWQTDIEVFSNSTGNRDKSIVFNTVYPIEYMFHTDVTAYRGVPMESTMDSLSSKGYTIYIVQEGNVPILRSK